MYLKNIKKPLGEKEYDFNNNKKYHYIVVTKPTVLLAKFLSNCDNDKFCSNCFSNFQNKQLIEKYNILCK